MKYKGIIIGAICLVCVVVFCIVAITGKIYTLDELPLNFMSAFLGAIVTAVFTLILLSGQSGEEEIRERNVIVFKKRSVIFEKFINRLYKVLQEQKINGNTYMEIKTEFYTKLVLYLKKKSQEDITAYLEKLAEFVGIEIDDGDVMDTFQPFAYMIALNKNYRKLKENIFLIINILIADLGLGDKMNINLQIDLEKNTFPYLSPQILLEEIDNLFMKKNSKFFEEAGFVERENELFISINIKGNITPGGRIEIGPFFYCPFFYYNQNKSGMERLIFRLVAPYSNPLAEPYVSNEEGSEGKYINLL